MATAFPKPLRYHFHLLPMISLALLFPSNFSVDASPNQQTMQSMINQVCADVEDQIFCQSDIQTRLQITHNHKSSSDHNEIASVLTAAMEASLNQAQLAIHMVSRFTTSTTASDAPSPSSSMSRVQMALDDCKELLDFTVTELGWSLAEMRKLRSSSTNNNTHSGGENLKAWLSAALSNQDTCLEGFEGTNMNGGGSSPIPGSLNKLTRRISNVLNLLYSTNSNTTTTTTTLPPFNPPPRKTGESSSSFPKWMTEGDKQLLKVVGSSNNQADAIVAQDGSGHYSSILEAVMNAPDHSSKRYVIYVKKGVYNENIDMKKKKTNIMLIGDGVGATVISGSRNFLQGYTTFRTPTFAVSGKGFIARDITFRNMAGPHKHQAVALRVDSDQSAFYRCSMEGYQDTLYAHSLRQFYRECTISGTIDFVFGNGAVVFQNCNFYTRVPLPMQKCTIMAQGRKSPNQTTGFSIQDSYIYATQPSYLGRPWKEYSRVVYISSYMSGMIQPKGWIEWYGEFALSTLYFGEYKNYGPGASTVGRVKWPGYLIIRGASEAAEFTVGRFLNGMTWLPATGVRFTTGLTN